jgi:hypothetical protein
VTRTLKNQPGDWVAVKMPTGDRPGKVVAATRESVTVEFRNGGKTSMLTFDHPLPRIHWQRQNGRSRWSYV